jgi:hypothetical protein
MAQLQSALSDLSEQLLGTDATLTTVLTEIVATALQELIEAELTARIGAEPGERTPGPLRARVFGAVAAPVQLATPLGGDRRRWRRAGRVAGRPGPGRRGTLLCRSDGRTVRLTGVPLTQRRVAPLDGARQAGTDRPTRRRPGATSLGALLAAWTMAGRPGLPGSCRTLADRPVAPCTDRSSRRRCLVPAVGEPRVQPHSA